MVHAGGFKTHPLGQYQTNAFEVFVELWGAFLFFGSTTGKFSGFELHQEKLKTFCASCICTIWSLHLCEPCFEAQYKLIYMQNLQVYPLLWTVCLTKKLLVW